MPNALNEFAEIRFFPGSTEIEVLSARYDRHQFPRHCHCTYLIEVVTAGVDEFLCGRHTYRAEPGDIIFVHPGEVHTGKSAGNVPLEYHALYPTPRLMARLAERAGRPAPPDFRSTIVRDPELASRIEQAATAVDSADATKVVELALEEAIRRYASTTRQDGCREEPFAVKQIKELVRLDPARNHRLEDLAEHCGFSPFYLVRLFTQTVGLPPHEYLHAYRAELAREMLRSGSSARAASDFLGYADQAHFTRKFRQIVGVNPGRFRRKPRSVRIEP